MENVIEKRDNTNRGSIKARPLAEILASRDACEGIAFSAANLARLVDHAKKEDCSHRLNNRFENSLPKIYLLKAARRREHLDVIERALGIMIDLDRIPERTRLASELMLAELKDDSLFVSRIADRYPGIIARMPSKLQCLVDRAQQRIDFLPIARERPLRFDVNWEENQAVLNVMELRKAFDTIFVLRILGDGLPTITQSLELILSEYGRDRDPNCKHDIRRIAAEVMLAGL